MIIPGPIPGPILRATRDDDVEAECLLYFGNVALTRFGIHGSYEIIHIPTGYAMCNHNFYRKHLPLAFDLIYEYSKHDWAFDDPKAIPEETKKFMDRIKRYKKYRRFFCEEFLV